MNDPSTLEIQTTPNLLEPEETDSQEKVTPLNQFFIGFGPLFLPDEIDFQSAPQLNLHAAVNWDLDSATLKLFGDFTFNDSRAGLAIGGIGVNAFLLPDREMTPLAGAELGYGAAYPEGLSTTGGFIVAGVVGAQFFRTSTVNLELAFRGGFFTTDIRGNTPWFSGFRVGILF